MTPTGTIWPLADRAVRGRLREIVLQHQSDGLSAEKSARLLESKHKLPYITASTVSSWRKQLAAEPAPVVGQ